MNYYTVDLANIDAGDSIDFLQGIDVGSHSCDVYFSWDNTIQEQYDEYMNSVITASLSDPLIDIQDEHNSVRDYDYLNYYLSIPRNTIRDWLLTCKVLPSSLRGRTLDQQEQLVTERITLCENIKRIIDQYGVMLTWYVSITFRNETIQGKLIPGAIYTNVDGTFSLEVQCEKNYIGKEDLPYVSFRIGVEE